MAKTLRESLDGRVKALGEEWVGRMTTALDEGRLVDALRTSARPPEPSTRCPSDVATRLAESASAALTPETDPREWMAILDAVCDSPVRRNVKPVGIPPENDTEAAARNAAGLVPALAKLLGLRIPPPPPRRGQAETGRRQDAAALPTTTATWRACGRKTSCCATSSSAPCAASTSRTRRCSGAATSTAAAAWTASSRRATAAAPAASSPLPRPKSSSSRSRRRERRGGGGGGGVAHAGGRPARLCHSKKAARFLSPAAASRIAGKGAKDRQAARARGAHIYPQRRSLASVIPAPPPSRRRRRRRRCGGRKGGEALEGGECGGRGRAQWRAAWRGEIKY